MCYRVLNSLRSLDLPGPAGAGPEHQNVFAENKAEMPRKRLLRTAAWASLTFIVYATLSPVRDRPTLLTSSTVEHVAAFVISGALFCLAYPRRIPTVLIFVLGSAASLEFLQLLAPDRHARILDGLQKIAGGVLGVFVGRAILYVERARSRPEV
jgi:VanZ family protein